MWEWFSASLTLNFDGQLHEPADLPSV